MLDAPPILLIWVSARTVMRAGGVDEEQVSGGGARRARGRYAARRNLMKSRYQGVPPAAPAKKPRKAHISDAEFRRRLKDIAEWRRKRLAALRAKNPR